MSDVDRTDVAFAIKSALRDHGTRSETDLLRSVVGRLGAEPEDYRDVLDQMIDDGDVVYEVNEYMQEDIYSLVEGEDPHA